MKRTQVTYGQLDRVLRGLGFSCRIAKNEPPARVYEHKESGAIILLPTYPEKDRVFDYHLAEVRIMLDGFGVADPSVFEAQLQKAG
jgi:hypothetical protein